MQYSMSNMYSKSMEFGVLSVDNFDFKEAEILKTFQDVSKHVNLMYTHTHTHITCLLLFVHKHTHTLSSSLFPSTFL